MLRDERRGCYAQAAYTVGNTWDCVPSCQQSETVGTVLDYTWHNISPASVGFLGHNNRTRIIVVSFRGTKDVDDWVQDSEFSLDAWPPHVPGSMVHHGFLSAYQSVATGVMREIVRLAARHPTYRIVFTGHSLGGAEAVLCAVDTLHRHSELVHRTHIYTYGMPRIGNSDWADSVEGLGIPVYRVVYENDMVVHIPFQWLGYTHFAQEVWIHRNRTVFCGAKTRESPVCSAGVSLSDYSIADHSQYTEADWMFVLQGSRVV
ncbi:hypothetical protein LPJ61_001466 [Coemansia biformis]|uniref:Fungal lipase-type domain-containing protein n=1 Tax=Coemansia biformis TaxID=1286918 RepID=A0A9W7YHM7_9FUNG|nr:hypothetical protein LPJ61_001466 [Coemansia biformis]